MTLVRWQPYKGLRGYEDELDGFFNCYGTSQCKGAFSPEADIQESQEAYLVTLEIPGVQKEDVSIALKEDILSIKGEKKKSETEEKVTTLSSERRYGAFEKQFTVPRAIQADAIKADYANGILNLRIPKAEEAKPKQISID